MVKLNEMSSSYNSNLATSPSSHLTENFSEFNTIDDQRMNLPILQGINEESESESEIAINYDVEGDDEPGTYPQFVTYVDHPVIKNKFNLEYEFPEPSTNSKKNENQKRSDVNIHFDGIVNFYFASISIVGLFILFRAIQKSKY